MRSSTATNLPTFGLVSADLEFLIIKEIRKVYSEKRNSLDLIRDWLSLTTCPRMIDLLHDQLEHTYRQKIRLQKAIEIIKRQNRGIKSPVHKKILEDVAESIVNCQQRVNSLNKNIQIIMCNIKLCHYHLAFFNFLLIYASVFSSRDMKLMFEKCVEEQRDVSLRLMELLNHVIG